MEGLDYVDLARSLIQPSQNSFEQWQRPSQSSSDQVATSVSSTVSLPAVSGNTKVNENLFSQNHGQAASPADSKGTTTDQSTSSPAPTLDRAAQLKAQFLASNGSRKRTPDPAKSIQTTTTTTSAGPSMPYSVTDTQASDHLIRPAIPQPVISSADVDDLIASGATGNLVHKSKISEDNSTKSFESGEIPSHEPAVDRREASTPGGLLGKLNGANDKGNGNVRPESARQIKLQEPGLDSPRERQDARTQSNEKQIGRSSISSNAGERKRVMDKDRTDRERAAAAWKANVASPAQRNDSLPKKNIDNAPKAQPQKMVVNGTSVVEPAAPQQLRPLLDGFDVNVLPIEIAQWLDITNFHDEEYRTRELGRHNKRLELERQMRELEQEGLEDRTRVIRGPSLMQTSTLSTKPQSPSSVATPSTPTSAQAQKKLDAASSTSAKPVTVLATNKRPREEEARETATKSKTIKTEPRSLESRITREEPTDHPRRRSPLPAQYNAYQSYNPPPRDRYDSYHDRSYGYNEREHELRERDREHMGREHERERDREREREWEHRDRERRDLDERDRYDRLPYDDEEEEHGPPSAPKKAGKGKKQWSGVPCVPCRYFKQGSCHRGSTCSFLHE